MSVLNGLKLVAAKQERQTNPVQIRRAKLMAALDEQIALAKARQAGESYTATRAKRVKDDAGNVSVQRVAKRLKAWFWAVEGGRVCVAVRYGNKVMELGKGKTAVESAAGELVSTLGKLRDAVAAGELDAQMESASASVRKGFKR
jgi:hypothetical protein